MKRNVKRKDYNYNTLRKWIVDITSDSERTYQEMMDYELNSKCKELPNDYWITEDGHYFRVKYIGDGKIEIREKKPTINNAGYLQVSSPFKPNSAINVHTLVAMSFLNKPRGRGKKEVNHKDMDKTNNTVENLEWVTHKQNMAHYKENRLINI